MNSAFRSAVEAFKGAAMQLTHEQQVTRLYRSSLRLLASWAVDRRLFCEEALKIRAQFDANKHLPKDSGKVKRLIREAKEKMHYHAHPDKYVVPFMPGGTLFMRNPAPPLELVYPDGIPEGVSTRQLNIDMSNVPPGQKHGRKTLVDSATKSYVFLDD